MQKVRIRKLVLLSILLPLLVPAVTLAKMTDRAAGETPSNLEPQSPNVIEFDVAVSKSAPATVLAGDSFPFVITVTNNGPNSADGSGVPLSDNLSSDVSFVSVSVSAPDTSATCSHSGSPSGGTVTCNLGQLGPGETATVTITVKTDILTPGGKIITNEAKSDPLPEDTDNTNNVSNKTSTRVIAIRPVGGYGEPLSPFELLSPWLALVTIIAMGAGMMLFGKRIRLSAGGHR